MKKNELYSKNAGNVDVDVAVGVGEIDLQKTRQVLS
jgi:hypothetical protein